ncbi:MAG: cytochrome c peroxidase, partial [Emcibacteraceae bacterium]|nr:cytochrome c peroxidase [Emcibacteraceae bacterium]
MLKHINLNFKFSIIFVLLVNSAYAEDNAKEAIIKNAILENGFLPAVELFINKDALLFPEGEVFFNSEHLSLNGNISCATCHFPEKSSGDGISNAAGVGGVGEGYERLMSGAKVVPRNSLALW